MANRDLIERALALEGKVLEVGTVEWVWEPRGVRGVAVKVLDEMEAGWVDEDEDEPIGMVWEEVDLLGG